MKQDQVEHDDFDIFLKKQLQQAQPYVEDNDFTANVMNQLPAAKTLGVWQERLIILIPFMIISLLVLSQFSLLNILIKLWSFLVAVQVTNLMQIGLVTMLAVISGASFWFAKQFKLI
ncbi:MAG: hypothetical protein EOO53_01980 [Gammaproteobacteria bacterium]|nr:MAG: hypothetical protein EOO53_01980 [Gammaproteobacteria bacterium]